MPTTGSSCLLFDLVSNIKCRLRERRQNTERESRGGDVFAGYMTEDCQYFNTVKTTKKSKKPAKVSVLFALDYFYWKCFR